MPVEISLPFRVAPDGSIAQESDANKIADQHMKALVNTEPGERVMLPDYGVPTAHLLFDADDELVQQELAVYVQQAAQRYEPGLVVTGINAIPTLQGDGLAQIEVTFQRADAPDSLIPAKHVNTAVIHIDGSVSEVIRG